MVTYPLDHEVFVINLAHFYEIDKLETFCFQAFQPRGERYPYAQTTLCYFASNQILVKQRYNLRLLSEWIIIGNLLYIIHA